MNWEGAEQERQDPATFGQLLKPITLSSVQNYGV